MAIQSIELVITVFLAISLLASIISRKTRTPYTVLLVVIGLVFSATSTPGLSSIGQAFNQLLVGGLFVGLILPPLLFESMLSIRVEEFSAVSRPALLLATVGVLIAAAVSGLILWRVAGLPVYPAFLYGALIAPTDVATVLEIFRRTKVPARLATLMDTESVFNDASGIALFTIVLTSFGTASIAPFDALSRFLLTLGGGALIGSVVAWGARQLQRESDDMVSQVVLTMASVYGAYGVATAVGASGLIAVAVAGLLYGNTVLFRIGRKETADFVRQFWAVLAFIANTAAFLFIGFSTSISGLLGSASAIVIAYGVVLVARFASVYPILGITRVSGERIPASWKNVAMLGGMRGALSIALVATIPADFPGRDLIASMTFGVAILSIILQGPLLTRYAGRAFGRQQTLPEVQAASQGSPGG